MDLTWFDSNTWLIEMGHQRILLDPWLVGPLVFGNLPWLFKGERSTPRSIPDSIDLILLSQGLEDHAHPPTLKALDRQIPVVASPSAAKVAQDLGYSQVTPLAHGETFTLPNCLEIHALPGSPIGPMTIENGYLLRDLITSASLYYEPHGFHHPSLKAFAPVDVVLTPIANLSIPLLGPVIKGQQSALEVLQWLTPQFVLPTAAGGDFIIEGLLKFLLRAEGTSQEFQDLLAAQGCATQLIEPTPGQRCELVLQTRQVTVP